MSKDEFLSALASVYGFYGQELTKFSAQVWLQACEVLGTGNVSKALSAHIVDPERGQYMPKPADIVRKLQGTAGDRALIAWGKVMDAAARVGAYQSVCFDDPVIHATIEDIGGWQKVCRTETDKLSYMQHQFAQTYKAYADRKEISYPAVLPGEHAITNAVRGCKSSPPTLIGDPRKALLVLQAGGEGAKTQITSINLALEAVRRLPE